VEEAPIAGPAYYGTEVPDSGRGPAFDSSTDQLTGTIAGPQGEPTEIKDGKVDKDTVTFRVEREFNGSVFKIDYNGKINGDTIEGKSEMERNGEKRTRDWKAKRAS